MARKLPNHIKPLKVPKIIIVYSQFLALFSIKLVVRYVFKLFTTPIRHKFPKRELEMIQKSKKQFITIPSINKEIAVYQYGSGEKKILLVHGWSGRGTQLYKIAAELIQSGYTTISFDAPAHGKSPGNSSIMMDFIAAIMEIDKRFGPFEAAIGHSLGGMAILNALKDGLKVNRTAIIGSGDLVQDVIDDFVAKLKLNPQIAEKIALHLEKKYGAKIHDYDASKAASSITIPTLVIHDENDPEVPMKAALHIHKHLQNGELMLTTNLGHRKILGDSQVIQKISTFIKK